MPANQTNPQELPERLGDFKLHRIVSPIAGFYDGRGANASLHTQLPFGHYVYVRENEAARSLTARTIDEYFNGVVWREDVEPFERNLPATHRLRHSTVVWRDERPQSAPAMRLPINALVRAEGEEGSRTKLAKGWILTSALVPLEQYPDDPATVALAQKGNPYVWGVLDEYYDCSGLVKTALFAAGIDVPHSAAGILKHLRGKHLPLDVPRFSHLQRNDVVFWEGHVGLMASSQHLVHAKATPVWKVECIDLMREVVRQREQGGSDVLAIIRPKLPRAH